MREGWSVRHIRAVAAVRQLMYQFVVVELEKKLKQKARLLIYSNG